MADSDGPPCAAEAPAEPAEPSAHEAQMRKLEAELKERHAEHIAQLERSHKYRLQEVGERHESRIRQLEHARTELYTKLQKAGDELNDRSFLIESLEMCKDKCVALEAEVTEVRRALDCALAEKHAAEWRLEAAETQFREDMRSLEAKHIAENLRLNQLVSDSRAKAVHAAAETERLKVEAEKHYDALLRLQKASSEDKRKLLHTEQLQRELLCEQMEQAFAGRIRQLSDLVALREAQLLGQMRGSVEYVLNEHQKAHGQEVHDSNAILDPHGEGHRIELVMISDTDRTGDKQLLYASTTPQGNIPMQMLSSYDKVPKRTPWASNFKAWGNAAQRPSSAAVLERSRRMSGAFQMRVSQSSPRMRTSNSTYDSCFRPSSAVLKATGQSPLQATGQSPLHVIHARCATATRSPQAAQLCGHSQSIASTKVHCSLDFKPVAFKKGNMSLDRVDQLVVTPSQSQYLEDDVHELRLIPARNGPSNIRK